MVEIIQALEEYYDFLTIGVPDGWAKIRIAGIKGDTTVEAVGYTVETTLQELLLNTVRFAK